MNDLKAQNAMQIILHAGDARVKCTEALDALNNFDIQKARTLMAEAKVEIVEAHKAQTDVIQEEARGENSEYSVLFTHAQDTVMTVYSEMNMTNHLIDFTEALDKRLKAIEQK